MEVDSNPLTPVDYMEEDAVNTNENYQLSDDMYTVAVLLDDLKHDDVQFRLIAMKKLPLIASALGEMRTRNELLPFLQELVDDEDDVLLMLAEQLAELVPAVGGIDFAYVLLAPLENLVAVEEPTVRDRAILSLCEITRSLPSSSVVQYVLPLLKRLSLGEWFTSRTSAAGLYAAVYKKVSPALQSELKSLFAGLVDDQSPMVRRAAAKALVDLTEQFGPEDVLGVALVFFKKIAEDDQDSVRLLAVEVMAAIAKLLTIEQRIEHLLPAFRNLATDKSWRVKYMVACHYVDIANAFKNPIVRDHFIEPFVDLVKDSEAEVRTAAAGQISGFAQYIEKQVVVDSLLPCVEELVADGNEHARAALAKEVSGLAPILGKEATPKYLLPIFLHLLRDESSEVRLNVISKLDELNEVVGVDSLSQSLLPAIMELSEDKQWRVRLQIIEYMPVVARQLGEKIFDERLFGLCVSWLRDKVFSIRSAATTNLKNLTEVFGIQWAKKTAIPQVLVMVHEENYLHRMTTIYALTTIAQVLSAEDIRDCILPTIVSLSNDSIPNIRFNVAKSLENMIPLLKQDENTLNNTVHPVLEKLANDSDGDVRFFATRALEGGAKDDSPEAKL
ncbi:armadillo-type protein [Dichotomocladium elegans]|nr:armadillo-type protein [Dichotomocladium elegans]